MLVCGIVDCGSQYTLVLCRRLRSSLGVTFDIVSEKNFKGHSTDTWGCAIITGSPGSSGDQNVCSGSPKKELVETLLSLKIPVLGICYGMQLLASYFGGEVDLGNCGAEYGQTTIHTCGDGSSTVLFRGLSENIRNSLSVWMSHSDSVVRLDSPGFRITSRSANGSVASIENEVLEIYGVQFHPELEVSEYGEDLLSNFVFRKCDLRECKWDVGAYLSHSIEEIRRTMEQNPGDILLAASGGVDSTVVGALLDVAVPGRTVVVSIDNGLLRKGDLEHTKSVVSKHMSHAKKVVIVDASEEFLASLCGVEDPEAKRKIIGSEFVKQFRKVVEGTTTIGEIKYLAQGTILPDVIESGGSGRCTIKSHHNVGGLDRELLGLELVEPLKDVFKDEVRVIGELLGLPADSVLNRHPFPGPGLGIRVVGCVTKDKCDIVRAADSILIQCLQSACSPVTGKSYYESVSQAFVVFLPVRAVGVQGDNRTYKFTVVIRIVETNDFMTASVPITVPHELLMTISSKIMNEIDSVNRVLYDISMKPPATIEWE